MVDLIGPERGVFGPEDVIFGPDGMLYIVDRTNFRVERLDPATGSHSTYVELPFGPDNIAFAPTGALFVSSYTDGVVAMALPGGPTALPHRPALPGGRRPRFERPFRVD